MTGHRFGEGLFSVNLENLLEVGTPATLEEDMTLVCGRRSGKSGPGFSRIRS